jgi:hypothetical protein
LLRRENTASHGPDHCTGTTWNDFKKALLPSLGLSERHHLLLFALLNSTFFAPDLELLLLLPAKAAAKRSGGRNTLVRFHRMELVSMPAWVVSQAVEMNTPCSMDVAGECSL